MGLMESQIRCSCSVVLCGSKLRKETMAGAWSLVLSRRKLSPGTCPHAGYFSFSMYATGAPPAAALVLEPRESEYA